ncbi:hypothetical protein OG21DRAFT_1523264 [Imleria badia]|nr:hypothetical protein OG21DRAFT_1523264 [Imleria badia]
MHSLPNFTFRRSAGLQNMLKKLLGHARAIRYDERDGEPAALRDVSWESLLSTLWNGVVNPVLDAWAFSTPADLSPIFWCPIGPFVFLPIHAAGLYGIQHSHHEHKVSDFVISSYVPTLSILERSPNPVRHWARALAVLKRCKGEGSGNLRLLAVGQLSSDGLSQLPGVATELEHIRNSLLARTTLLVESSVGTVEEVLSLMKMADRVHFACHGIQDVGFVLPIDADRSSWFDLNMHGAAIATVPVTIDYALRLPTLTSATSTQTRCQPRLEP